MNELLFQLHEWKDSLCDHLAKVSLQLITNIASMRTKQQKKNFFHVFNRNNKNHKNTQEKKRQINPTTRIVQACITFCCCCLLIQTQFQVDKQTDYLYGKKRFHRQLDMCGGVISFQINQTVELRSVNKTFFVVEFFIIFLTLNIVVDDSLIRVQS